MNQPPDARDDGSRDERRQHDIVDAERVERTDLVTVEAVARDDDWRRPRQDVQQARHERLAIAATGTAQEQDRCGLAFCGGFAEPIERLMVAAGPNLDETASEAGLGEHVDEHVPIVGSGGRVREQQDGRWEAIHEPRPWKMWLEYGRRCK